MADAVTTSTVFDDDRQTIVHLTSISDGTGEAAVAKVTFSSLRASDTSIGLSAATVVNIERVEWAITGWAHVQLLWKATANSTALVLPAGVGSLDFSGLVNNGDGQKILRHAMRTAGLPNPKGSGVTGDILLTSAASVATGRYAITLYLVKAP